MRRLTKRGIGKIVGREVKGYNIESARIKNGPFIDGDHYGIVLGKNAKDYYVTWDFHLLDDESITVYWGHYFMEDREAAIRDFNKRSQEV